MLHMLIIASSIFFACVACLGCIHHAQHTDPSSVESVSFIAFSFVALAMPSASNFNPHPRWLALDPS